MVQQFSLHKWIKIFLFIIISVSYQNTSFSIPDKYVSPYLKEYQPLFPSQFFPEDIEQQYSPVNRKTNRLFANTLLTNNITIDNPSFSNQLRFLHYEGIDLWSHVSNHLQLPVPTHTSIRSHKQWYLKNKSYIHRVSKRAEPYLYDIVTELKKHNIPLEIALIPIIESAYDPFAYSHGRASGLWQFIPGTGNRFGLKRNRWYDGRRDIYLSTRAAINYFKYLEKLFKGNWLHAIAAYNAGEGTLLRAIKRNRKRNKPTDFWSLSLPKETTHYIPKLLALADLLKNKHIYHLDWHPVSNKPYFARVSVDSQIDLILAAQFAEIDMDTFYRLNPAFNQWATEPNKKSFFLIPKDNVKVFNTKLQKTPKNKRIAFKYYTIKSGDSLSTIAKKYNTSTKNLMLVNELSSHNIRVGKSLLIPVASSQPEAYKESLRQRILKKQNRKRRGTQQFIYVKPGDSFWSLSNEYKVSVRELAQWNHMAPGDPLHIGKKLVVWRNKKSNKRNTINKTRKIHYRVKKGDSLAKIANKFRVSIKEIIRWNKINPSKYLQPKQKLILYIDVAKQF